MASIIETVRRAIIDAMIECMCVHHNPVCLIDASGRRCALQPFVYEEV